MSWEAVTWANRQKLKKSYEQIVLLVLANCADPNGEAFVKWPGREHWWVYLSERTRLPKSSLFRHLNTLVALGLGERTMQVLTDGSRRPTFKLNMDAAFDIDLPEDSERYNAAFARTSGENQSPVGTEPEGDADEAENNSDISASHGAETPLAPQSPRETGVSLRPETGPFPVLGLHKDSKPFSKDSPLPPSGGASVRDEVWDQFVGAWGEPIPKMAIARHAWDHTATEKRGEAVAAAKGYWCWLKAHPKPPSAQSAQSFLRDVAGWAQWLRYTPGASGTTPSAAASISCDSPEGRAIVKLYEVARTRPFVSHGVIRYLRPVTAQLLRLADAPERNDWVWIDDRQQIAAWSSFLSEYIASGRPELLTERGTGADRRRGFFAPWPWPPRKDGALSPAGGDGLMSATDFEDFK